MKTMLLLRAIGAATLLSTFAFAAGPQAPRAAAPTAAAAATSNVTRAPNGRFATPAYTMPSRITQHPKELLVTGGKPIPMGAMMISGGTLQRLPTRYGEEPPPAAFVTPMRTWQGGLVTQRIQFERDGHFWEYDPTKHAPAAGTTTAHIPLAQQRAQADKIQKMNEFGDGHRINGPEVVWGAIKRPDGSLVPVKLAPGSAAYQKQLYFLEHRVGGEEALVNPRGKVVYGPSGPAL